MATRYYATVFDFVSVCVWLTSEHLRVCTYAPTSGHAFWCACVLVCVRTHHTIARTYYRPPIGDLASFYKEAKGRFDDDAEFKKRAYLETASLQSGGDADVTLGWNQICDVSRAEFQKIYERLDATLEEKGESFYQSRMVQLVKDLEAASKLSPCPDGTPRKLMWTRDPEVEGNIPLTIQKSDGTCTSAIR